MQELSFKEILKTLIPKLKVLLVILLIGAVAGGCIGIARTYAARFYGTTLEFYVNPKKGDDNEINQSQFGVYGAYGWHVMDNITKLLSSESFAEDMLLGDDGLPIEEVLSKEEDRTSIDEKIEAAKGPIKEYKDALAAAEAAAEDYAQKQLAYATASATASKANTTYLSLVNAGASDAEKQQAKQNAEDAATAETQAKLELEAAEQEKILKEKEAQSKQKASNEKTEDVLELWRETEVYGEYITLISKSVKYSFYNDTDIQMNSTEALAKSFIYVNISVSKSEEFANFVYDRITEVLPRFVEVNMAVPSGYTGTKCQKITRLDNIEQTDSGELFSAAIKYAILFGILAFVGAAVCIVLFERGKVWVTANKAIFTSDGDDVSLGDDEVSTIDVEEAAEGDSSVEWQ